MKTLARASLFVAAVAAFTLPLPAVVAHHPPPTTGIPYCNPLGGCTSVFFTDEYRQRVPQYGHTHLTQMAAQFVRDSGRDPDNVLTNEDLPGIRYSGARTATDWLIAGAAFADSWGNHAVSEDSVNHFYTFSRGDHTYGNPFCVEGPTACFRAAWRNSADYADMLFGKAVSAIDGTWTSWCEDTGVAGSWTDINDNIWTPYAHGGTCNFTSEEHEQALYCIRDKCREEIEAWIGTSDEGYRCKAGATCPVLDEYGGCVNSPLQPCERDPRYDHCLYKVHEDTVLDGLLAMPCVSAANGMFLLGWALHLVEDSAVPFHSMTDADCRLGWCMIGGDGHEFYEQYVMALLQMNVANHKPIFPLQTDELPLTECASDSRFQDMGLLSTSAYEADGAALGPKSGKFAVVWPPMDEDCDPVSIPQKANVPADYRKDLWSASKGPGAWIRENAAIASKYIYGFLLNTAQNPIDSCDDFRCIGAVATLDADRGIKTSASVIYRFLAEFELARKYPHAAWDKTPPTIKLDEGQVGRAGREGWIIGSSTDPAMSVLIFTIRDGFVQGQRSSGVGATELRFDGKPLACELDNLFAPCFYTRSANEVMYVLVATVSGTHRISITAEDHGHYQGGPPNSITDSWTFRFDFDDPSFGWDVEYAQPKPASSTSAPPPTDCINPSFCAKKELTQCWMAVCAEDLGAQIQGPVPFFKLEAKDVGSGLAACAYSIDAPSLDDLVKDPSTKKKYDAYKVTGDTQEVLEVEEVLILCYDGVQVAPGVHRVRVQATDHAGRTGRDEFEITVPTYAEWKEAHTVHGAPRGIMEDGVGLLGVAVTVPTSALRWSDGTPAVSDPVVFQPKVLQAPGRSQGLADLGDFVLGKPQPGGNDRKPIGFPKSHYAFLLPQWPADADALPPTIEKVPDAKVVRDEWPAEIGWAPEGTPLSREPYTGLYDTPDRGPNDSPPLFKNPANPWADMTPFRTDAWGRFVLDAPTEPSKGFTPAAGPVLGLFAMLGVAWALRRRGA